MPPHGTVAQLTSAGLMREASRVRGWTVVITLPFSVTDQSTHQRVKLIAEKHFVFKVLELDY